MALRLYPINSPSDAAEETLPGVNDFDLTRIETNLMTKGIVQGVGDAFAVVENSGGANMTVEIGAGLALIEYTNTNVSHGRTIKSWFENTETIEKSITTADGTHPRIDRIVLRVDVITDPNAAASNIAIVEVLAGTPAASPSAPAEPANSITIATVSVPAGDTTISDGQITDLRTYLDLESDVLAGIARYSKLASNSNGEGASLIGVEDAAGNFVSTDLEGVLEEMYDLIPTSLAGNFGDGSDGNVTISTPTTLTRDMYYNDLTINTGQTLNPAGYRIFVKGTLTLTGTGKIISNGNNGGNGGNASGITPGTAGTAGAALAAGYFPASLAGVAGGGGGGGNGGVGGAGTAGNNGNSQTASSGGATGAAGGAGGTGASAGGGAGTGGGVTPATVAMRTAAEHILGLVFIGATPTQVKLNGGAGAGGGGGPGQGAGGGNEGGGGGGGGGSGSNGGYMLICAKVVSGDGDVEAKGGNGGSGGNGASGSGSGTAGQGGGGGAGGSGGRICLITSDTSAWNGSLVVTGGSAGAAGTGGSVGNAGTAGQTFTFIV